MEFKKTIWVGRYQYDIKEQHFFGSICLFGEEYDNNYVYNENYISYIDFLYDRIEWFIQIDSDINFYFYDPSFIYYLPLVNRKNCFFANSIDTYLWLNNKSISRTWMKSVIKVSPFVVLSNKEITLRQLKSYFHGYDEFIAQKMVSCGGEGTYVLSVESNVVLEDALYIVSPYYKNTLSLNITVLISESISIYFKPSVQIIEQISNRLLYKGSDFLAINSISSDLNNKIISYTKILCIQLRNLGYKGICGIDYLFYDNELYFLEFNPRFQGSSFLIERALNNKGLSLYELNRSCFFDTLNKEEVEIINSIDIPYSYLIDGIKKSVYTNTIVKVNMEMSSNGYYDFFSDIYHIMLPDWEKSINTQGTIFQQIFENFANISIEKVLDCTCGIGIQAISLALLGYNVTGSDISERELARAKQEALKRNVKINFLYADCRFLDNYINQKYDAILSIDSALPHLMTKENFVLAFSSIYRCLNDGGIFLSSYRDYAALLQSKPDMAYPIRFKKEDDTEYTIFRRWKWQNNIIFSRQYVIEETEKSSILLTSDYTQWAITKDELFSIAKEVGYNTIYWLLPEESGFSQPILCLLK